MKRLKELKENQKLLMIFGVLILALIAVGVTYAFFSYSKEGSTENTLKSGSITFWYDEQNREGNGISIVDALPISDANGKIQTKAFNFKIQSTTSSTTTIPYEITLRQKQGTDNIGNIVKVYLAKTSSIDATVASEEEVELSLFSSLSNVTKNGYSEKLLHTDIVPASDTPYTQNYRLKMWVDENADYSDGSLNNKTFSVMVNVYASGHVLNENSSVATINSVSVGGTELTKTEVEGIDTYTATLPEGTTSTTINVEAGDYDKVTVTKTESDYQTPVAVSNNIERLSNTVAKTVNLTDGANYFKIVVISEDTTGSKEIHIKISTAESIKIFGDSFEVIQDEPTLTDTSINDKSGLYVSTATNSGDPTYYFRGNVENNRVKFAEKDWRIIRINEDGTIRLILEDSIDTKAYQYSKSDNNLKYMYFTNSAIKTNLETWYDSNIKIDDNYFSKVANGNYFCEEAKTAVKQNNFNFNTVAGSTFMTIYDQYTPNFRCETDDNGYDYANTNVGLINYDEAVFAGGYYGSHIKNWYLYKNYAFWTMSTSGLNKNGYSTMWVVYSATSYDYSYIATFRNTDSNGGRYLRPVINLKADTTATKQEIDGKTYYVVD